MRAQGCLHFSAASTPAASKDIMLWSEEAEKSDIPEWTDTHWHGTWLTEQRLFQSIMEGRIEDTSRYSSGKVGQIGGGDPLRQAKNESIVLSVICSRASILGGFSSESAYILSDYYINKLEAAQTVTEVWNVATEMHRMFTQRAAEARSKRSYSYVVRACLEYVDAHIMEKITLKDLAAEIGYHENYISRCVKKETGENLFDIINRKKVDIAKTILADRKMSLIPEPPPFVPLTLR